MHIITRSTGNVQLKIDPSVVLATRAYAEGLAVRASQAEAEAGTENSKLVTPLRVFQAIAKVLKQATENTFGWAKIATQPQVTNGKDDSTIITPKKLRNAQATQAEAESGTDTNKIMTPLSTFQAIRSASATETLRGVLRVGTQSEVNAGTLNTVIVTPAKMRAGFSYSLTSNGYIMFPSWLFGLTFMWGTTTSNASGIGNTAFPLAFPNVCWQVVGTGRAINPSLIGILGGAGAPTRTGCNWYSSFNGRAGVLAIDWIAIGR
jgi:hypothetical protein